MANDPLQRLPDVAALEVRSPDFDDGGALPDWARARGAGGQDLSPGLRWVGAPAATRSFVVRVFDPDAPTLSGFWHWAVYDLPAATDHLARGAGTPSSGLLPAGAVTVANELRGEEYTGAAPPAGHGEHRYFFVVSALSTPHLELSAGITPAVLGFVLREHELARGVTVGTSVTPA
ncbi:YbhB/YbcL family Raf kinase inhibitor-like protein [Protaetiibacter mangrovi]|uniref:YbhB/YbcL family Raf kinase inhibitor-like protein n=1 Tax=Protaetiibacter mangrovi TaxID=2970926 RepID=A0ABT1ZF03_9MICO|nr:YbhB/YbcL family Raf kinase inhibitor-like protein [Protaetiibacter mangrovi]MCS0499292.1 YbhB/YbcL family Raf kinase inhibitor-like protein [Protaetiibacter mangrovi]